LATHQDQQVPLRFVLDSLGNHFELECPGDPDDAFNQRMPLL
jgi:hypothetical protein